MKGRKITKKEGPLMFFNKYVLFILLIVGVLQAGEYQVDKEQENLVKFISDAPLEDFEGITDKIDGYIFWEGDDLLKNSELYFEVDLNSLDTGIGLRNRHMRENYLHTDKHPFTHFTGKLIKVENVQDGEYTVTAKGTMFIHGVEREKVIEGKLVPAKTGYQIQTSFSVALTDYNIEVPQLMFMKIDENMKLELDFYLKQVKKE
jgi:polyisoprenoid-binding protein YceI